MNNNKKTLKSIVFSMVLTAGMLLPASGFAQERGGGLFGRGDFNESDGWFRTLFDMEENLEEGFTNADFNEEAPLGSGLAILVGAGLGYVVLKKKEDKQ